MRDAGASQHDQRSVAAHMCAGLVYSCGNWDRRARGRPTLCHCVCDRSPDLPCISEHSLARRSTHTYPTHYILYPSVRVRLGEQEHEYVVAPNGKIIAVGYPNTTRQAAAPMSRRATCDRGPTLSSDSCKMSLACDRLLGRPSARQTSARPCFPNRHEKHAGREAAKPTRVRLYQKPTTHRKALRLTSH